MRELKYPHFSEISPEDFLPILNKSSTREHLIKHKAFDLDSVEQWIQGKMDEDAKPSCRIRAITVDEQLVGWCGVQFEDGEYEIAIILDDSCWGVGKRVFFEMISWAVEMGHKTVFIHLLHTRPEYKFLRKLARRVYQSELMGSKFTTYELDVDFLATTRSCTV